MKDIKEKSEQNFNSEINSTAKWYNEIMQNKNRGLRELGTEVLENVLLKKKL